MKRKNLALGLLSATLFAACTKEINEPIADSKIKSNETATTIPETPAAERMQRERYVSNEVLVKFKKGTSNNGRANAFGRITGAVKEKVLTKAMQAFGDDEGFVVVRTPLPVLEAVEKLRGGAEIEFAEPNYTYTHDATSDDTYYKGGSLWGMYGDGSSPVNKYGSQAAEAWAAGHTGSKSVIVGVIDEGIQYTHPDLSGQIWVNPKETADGKDNDGNDYIDDINGWDFAANNKSVYDGGITGSVDNHGTHVAGTIGAKKNAAGVVGVNWNVTIIACKFLGSNGGTTSAAIRAIDYLTDLKTRHGLNIVASNNSWGGGGYSQALYDAIQRANNKNILFVAAAGNNGKSNDATANYPSNYKNANVIAVASITSSGNLSSFSNYGSTTVDIGAPGSGIYSTTAYNKYSNYSGTSMATPHVTGAVALYASTHAGASAATIKSAILSSAVATPSLNGKCVTGGRLNVSKF